MTEPVAVVRQFFTLIETAQAEAATELLTEDVEWRNTGIPTIRGRRVAGILMDMDRRGIGFAAIVHHVAGNGDVVLTERTDVLRYRRWESRFGVCGTFVVRDGRIAVWDDHFSLGSVIGASLKGLLGTVRR